MSKKVNSWEHHGKGRPRAERMMRMYKAGHSLRVIANAHGGISRQAVHSVLLHFYGKDYTKEKGTASWRVEIADRNEHIAQTVIALGEMYYISPKTVANIIGKMNTQGKFSTQHAKLNDNLTWCPAMMKYCKCEIDCEER